MEVVQGPGTRIGRHIARAVRPSHLLGTRDTELSTEWRVRFSEVPAMQTEQRAATIAAPPSVRYLGFEIQRLDGEFAARPAGWPGEVLVAADLPTLRKRIWCWWYRVR